MSEERTMSKYKTSEILVVDDESDVCWALKSLIREAGLPVETVESGCEALDWMQKNRPAMIFLDAKLPDMEGLDVAREIRRGHAGIWIVMVSGYFFKDDPIIQHAMDKGLISDFIAKPFEHDLIRKTLEAVCS